MGTTLPQSDPGIHSADPHGNELGAMRADFPPAHTAREATTPTTSERDTALDAANTSGGVIHRHQQALTRTPLLVALCSNRMDSLPGHLGGSPEHHALGVQELSPRQPEGPATVPTATSAPAVMQAVGPAWLTRWGDSRHHTSASLPGAEDGPDRALFLVNRSSSHRSHMAKPPLSHGSPVLPESAERGAPARTAAIAVPFPTALS